MLHLPYMYASEEIMMQCKPTLASLYNKHAITTSCANLSSFLTQKFKGIPIYKRDKAYIYAVFLAIHAIHRGK